MSTESLRSYMQRGGFSYQSPIPETERRTQVEPTRKSPSRPQRRERSQELLQDIIRELESGWSISVSCKRANACYQSVTKWMHEFPEWRVIRYYRKSNAPKRVY